MHITDGRNETLHNTAEPVPRHSMSLASPHQCMSPSATNFTAHTSQSIQIARHSVVVEVPLNHAIQPLAHNGDGFMPPAHQLCPDGFECRSHSLLHRQACDLKSALPVGAATVRKSKKVKRFRLALAPTFAIDCRKSTKLDQPRLCRIQGQPKFGQSFPHYCEETSGCFFTLESVHTVVGIAHDNHISPCIPQHLHLHLHWWNDAPSRVD